MKRKLYLIFIAVSFLLPTFQIDAAFIEKEIPSFEASDVHRKSSVSKQEYDQIMDDLQNSYQEVIQAHGGRLVVEKPWEHGAFDAYANRDGKGKWTVHVKGGYARHPKATPDAIAIIACHELGHLIAGFPFFVHGGGWYSSEGEAEYFATRACARRLWKDQHLKNAQFRTQIKSVLKKKCDSVWKKQKDLDLCYRILVASEAHAALLANLSGDHFDVGQADPAVSQSTNLKHPSTQCRLDTHIAGALCVKPFSPLIIPGQNHPQGQQSLAAEKEAADQSCTRAAFYKRGSRPLCWYKPRLKSFFKIRSVKINDFSGNQNGALEPTESADVVVDIQNLTDKTYRSVKSTLTSSHENLDVLQSQSNYGAIPASSTRAGFQPFKVKLKEGVCAEDLDFNIKVDLGPGQEANFVHTSSVGRVVFSEPLTHTLSLTIPDKKLGRGPGVLDTALQVNEEEAFVKVHVSVNITHPSVGDIGLTLFSPSGKSFVLQTPSIVRGTSLKKTYVLRLAEELIVKGRWRLNIVDASPNPSHHALGVLNHWGLQFNRVICDSLKKK